MSDQAPQGIRKEGAVSTDVSTKCRGWSGVISMVRMEAAPSTDGSQVPLCCGPAPSKTRVWGPGSPLP